jgi:outer membrane protein OmpA-like peptidoglycan-associated protein
MKNLLLVCLLLLVAAPVLAQEEDAEGCKDPQLLTRMKGCWIYECNKKDFDRAELRVGRDADNRQGVEGEVERIDYDCPESVSELSIVRNAENALKSAGFKTVYSGPGDDDHPTYAGRKGGVWVSIETGLTGRPGYSLVIARSQEMEQQMVATAESMEADIAKSGSCSIYGVHFATGEATIQPESKECLDQVVKLLTNNPTWKMQIEGHTDSVGTADVNLKLSQARADAVRAWLVRHGIEGTRLTARGFGDTKPVGDNSTEEGRAKNRRVALVKL